jgi:hypothetical protein
MARKAKIKPEKGRVAEKKSLVRMPAFGIGFTSANKKLFIISLLVIIAGFVFLSRGSITLAPILLVLGYCVLVPLAVIYKSKRGRDTDREGR